MLRITAGNRRLCDGFNRRDVLHVGAAGLIGLSSARLARGQGDEPPGGAAQGEVADPVRPRRGPGAPGSLGHEARRPEEIRGEFKPIATTVPGLRSASTCRCSPAGAPPDACPLGPPHDRRPQRRGLFRPDRARAARSGG